MIRSLRSVWFQGARHLVAPFVAVLIAAGSVGAQSRFSYSSGQPLEPAYEGWMPNKDGSYTLYFGYMNTNWLQEFDIPVGAENTFSPGPADLGQPTHFYPRRNPFLFTVKVPKDFGTSELVWTLTANGVTRKTYGSLKSDYLIDPQVISTEVGGENGSLANDLRHNMPPDVKVDGPLTRTAKVGQPLSIVTIAGDPDNLPPRRDGKPQPGVVKAARQPLDASARPGPEQPRRRVSPAGGGRRVGGPRAAPVLDRLPRQGHGGEVHARSDEDVDGHTRVRQLDVVAAVRDPGAAGRRQVDRGRNVQRTGHLRAPRRCE